MARTTVATTADVTILAAYRLGGPSGKSRKYVQASIYDPAATSGGWVNGGTAGDFPASIFGLAKVEACFCTQVITTSSGAVARILPTAPDASGAGILFNHAGSATDTEAARAAIADSTLATTETWVVTMIGY